MSGSSGKNARFDLFVIGGGGAGSETAFRVGESKTLRVGLVERDMLGGECNNYGCVPTKALLKAAKVVHSARNAAPFGIQVRDVAVDFPKVMQRVRGIVSHFSRYGTTPFKEIGVEVYLGPTARFLDPERMELDDGTVITSKRFVVATGSKAAVPPIDGLRETGFWTNEEATHLTELPPSIAIVGGGPIGVEFAQIFARLGSTVTVIEALDRILGPEDADASAVLHESLESDGVRIITSAKVVKVAQGGSGKKISLEDGTTVDAAELLVAVGRTPSFGLLDPDKAGIVLGKGGKPELTATLKTTTPTIWCIGDATGDLLFTHVASYEGGLVSEQILTGKRVDADYRIVPRVTYTDPEVASVGISEQQAHDQGIDVVVGRVEIADNERAYIEAEPRGFVKIVAAANGGEILGATIVGANAGEMIHEIVAIMASHALANDAGGAIHAYPTLSESVRGALQGTSSGS